MGEIYQVIVPSYTFATERSPNRLEYGAWRILMQEGGAAIFARFTLRALSMVTPTILLDATKK